MFPPLVPYAISSRDNSATNSTVGAHYDVEIFFPKIIQTFNQAIVQQRPNCGHIVSLVNGGLDFWVTGEDETSDVRDAITQSFARYNQTHSRRRRRSPFIHDNAYIILAKDVNSDYHDIKYVFQPAGQNP